MKQITGKLVDVKSRYCDVEGLRSQVGEDITLIIEEPGDKGYFAVQQSDHIFNTSNLVMRVKWEPTEKP